jgi:hypothetical protein
MVISRVGGSNLTLPECRRYLPPHGILKLGVWFRRGRLLMVSPDPMGIACPLSGRNSTYRPAQILEAGSEFSDETAN